MLEFQTLNIHNPSLIFNLAFCQYQHKEDSFFAETNILQILNSLITKVQFRGVFRALSDI